MSIHEYPPQLVQILRRGADEVAPGAWSELYAVVYNLGDTLHITGTAHTPSGRVEPVRPWAYSAINDLVVDWLNELNGEGHPDWRAALVMSERSTGNSDVKLLQRDTPGVEEWDPTPTTLQPILSRLPEFFGRSGGSGAKPEAPATETFTASVDGKQFRIDARPAYKDQANVILGHFAANAAAAQAGLVMNLRWGAFRLIDDGGSFRVQAPTFDGAPSVTWGTDTTLAIWANAWQAATCTKAGVAPAECRYDQEMTVDRRAFDAERVVMERRPPVSPTDSGWHLRPSETEGSSEPVVIATHQLMASRRPLVRALLLPVGTSVIAGPTSFERVTGADGSVLIDGPY